jgi:hypothetical protein
MHRYLLVAFLLVSPTFAQSPTSSGLRSAAGCGPANVKLSVKTDKHQHPNTVPEAGKALLVVATQYEIDEQTQLIGHVTTRVGLDGNWIGANHQGSASMCDRTGRAPRLFGCAAVWTRGAKIERSGRFSRGGWSYLLLSRRG